jgi:hypothetical protein
MANLHRQQRSIGRTMKEQDREGGARNDEEARRGNDRVLGPTSGGKLAIVGILVRERKNKVGLDGRAGAG